MDNEYNYGNNEEKMRGTVKNRTAGTGRWE